MFRIERVLQVYTWQTLALLSACISCSDVEAVSKSDLSKEHIMGNIKSITEKEFEVDIENGEVTVIDSTKPRTTTIRFYNPEKYLDSVIEISRMDPFKVPWDADGNNVELLKRFYLSNGNSIDSVFCNGEFFKTTLRISLGPNLIDESDFNVKRELLERRLIELDNSGNIISKSTFDEEGKTSDFQMKHSYSKVSKGVYVENERHVYTITGELYLKVQLKYSNYNQVIEKHGTYTSDQESGRFTFFYQYLDFDHFNNWTRSVSYYQSFNNPYRCVERIFDYY